MPRTAWRPGIVVLEIKDVPKMINTIIGWSPDQLPLYARRPCVRHFVIRTVVEREVLIVDEVHTSAFYGVDGRKMTGNLTVRPEDLTEKIISFYALSHPELFPVTQKEKTSDQQGTDAGSDEEEP